MMRVEAQPLAIAYAIYWVEHIHFSMATWPATSAPTGLIAHLIFKSTYLNFRLTYIYFNLACLNLKLKRCRTHLK